MHPLLPRNKPRSGCWPGDLGDGRWGSGSGVVLVVVTGCMKGILTALLWQAVWRRTCCCISAGGSTCVTEGRAHKSYAATAEDKGAGDGMSASKAQGPRLHAMPRQPGRVPPPAGAANAAHHCALFLAQRTSFSLPGSQSARAAPLLERPGLGLGNARVGFRCDGG